MNSSLLYVVNNIFSLNTRDTKELKDKYKTMVHGFCYSFTCKHFHDISSKDLFDISVPLYQRHPVKSFPLKRRIQPAFSPFALRVFGFRVQEEWFNRF